MTLGSVSVLGAATLSAPIVSLHFCGDPVRHCSPRSAGEVSELEFAQRLIQGKDSNLV